MVLVKCDTRSHRAAVNQGEVIVSGASRTAATVFDWGEFVELNIPPASDGLAFGGACIDFRAWDEGEDWQNYSDRVQRGVQYARSRGYEPVEEGWEFIGHVDRLHLLKL